MEELEAGDHVIVISRESDFYGSRMIVAGIENNTGNVHVFGPNTGAYLSLFREYVSKASNDIGTMA